VGPTRTRRPLFSGETVLKKSRPTYETAEDTENERKVIRRVAEKLGLSAAKAPKFYPFDYSLVSGKKIVGFYEVKCRNYPIHKIDPVKISVHKVCQIVQMSQLSGVPAHLVVACEDGIWDCGLMPHVVKTFDVTMWGRNEPRDWQDTEPCFSIPVNRMVKIE